MYSKYNSFNGYAEGSYVPAHDPSLQKVQKKYFIQITHDKERPGLNETTLLDNASTAVDDEDSTDLDDEEEGGDNPTSDVNVGLGYEANSEDDVSVVAFDPSNDDDVSVTIANSTMVVQNINDIAVLDAEALVDIIPAAHITVAPNQKILEQALYLKRVQSNMICSPEMNSLVELYNILDKRGCANSLFDTIAQWAWINSSTFGSSPPMQRDKLVETVCHSVRGRLATEFMRPKQKALKLTTGRTVVITYFPIELMIMDLLSNEELMKRKHLLFSDIDQSENDAGHVDGNMLGEVNSGTWWNTAKQHECTQPNEVLWPIILFIDGMKVDSQGGRLALEPVSFTFSRFQRWLRHQPNAWRTWAYIEQVSDNAQPSADTGMSIGERNVQEYHDILKFLMDQLHDIQTTGIKWLFPLQHGRNVHVVLKIPIQFIIGDCEGHDKLAGRYKGHGMYIKGLCRDCDVPTALSDDVHRTCNYFTVNSIRDMNADDLKTHSFYDINNAFDKVSFGGDAHGIQGAIPPEPLHLYKLGHCDWLYEGFMYSLSQRIEEDLPFICKYFINANRGQSDREYPNIGSFRDGLAANGGTLRGYEKHGRIFFIYILLSCSDFVQHICQHKKRGSTYDIHFFRRFIALLEASLGFYEWWVLREHTKNTICDNNGTVNSSIAQSCVIKYLSMMKKRCPRKEFGKTWKMPKFHQTLHVPWNILRHGSMLNADGHHPESIAKKTVKDPASHTQRQKSKLSHQTGKRYIESLTMNEYMRLSGIGDFSKQFKYINPSTKEAKLSQRRPDSNQQGIDTSTAVSGGTSFIISIDYDNGNDDPLTSVTWLGTGQKPIFGYDPDMLHQLGERLFYPDDGGRIEDDRVPGFTCLTFRDHIFRAHPHYNCDHPWHDWVYLKWDRHEEMVPAQIEMFLDLRECNITDHRNADEEEYFSNQFLEKKIYAVVRSAISNDINTSKLNRFHLPLTLGYRVEMEVGRRLVPIDCFCSPCFAYVNHCGIGRQSDNTAIVLTKKEEWANEFLSLA